MSPRGKEARKEVRQRIRKRVEEKMRPLTLPNFITFTRMAMVPVLVIAVSDKDFSLALWIFVIAGLTDAFDGFLARRMDMKSRFGAYLDPIADKMLITVAYIALTFPQGQAVVIPLWLTILALFRDFVIMMVAGVLYMVEGLRDFPPSPLGKATTFAQVATVAVVLLANVFEVPWWIPTAFFYLSFILVIGSAFNYIYRVSRFVEEARQERQSEAGEVAGE
ncbi:MAG: CDP-alcohol phosphatidyltransferase family protein [Thermoanaerobaculales bacterium]|nr:CDP-alcohol phosphatidyltransferase family protein [Thermoanaerobaculales bacterium]